MFINVQKIVGIGKVFANPKQFEYGIIFTKHRASDISASE